MGKISDVIQHAGELNGETDDEDLWEEEDPAEDDVPGTEAEEDRKPECEAEAENTVTVEPPAAEDDFNVDNLPVQAVDDTAEQSEHNDPGQSEDDASVQEEFQPEENPECNEDGIPIKDILYAESVRRRGKDQILVQSVYDRKTIRDMLFRHAYLSTGGYCGLLISLCAIGAAIYTYGKIQTWISFVLLLAGCIFVVIEPFLLRDRAKQMTARGGIYHMPILFVLNPYGIELTRNGNHASHDWSDITRVTTTKYAVVLYKGKHTALVLTKKGIGEQKEPLYAMIRKCARNAKYMKLK